MDLRQLWLGRVFGGAMLCVGLSAVAARGETLADAIALAYQTNPNLQQQRAQARVSDESLVQAKAGYRPTVTLSAGQTQQDITSERNSTYQTAAVTLSQPVFTGGRVGSAIGAASADIQAAREELRRIEAAVVQATVQAYVDVRRDEEALAVRRNNVQILQKQLEEARARFEGGAITRTDVAQSQASLAAARVEVAQAEGQLKVSRAAYATVVGQMPGTLQPEPDLPNLPKTLEDAVVEGGLGNPALRGARFTEQASRRRVAEARADRMPSASVTASFAYEPINSLEPHSPYIRNFTAAANVTVPLYQGGVLNSRVRQAMDRNNADQMGIEIARRTMVQNVSDSWADMLTAQQGVLGNTDQVEAAKVAFEGAQEEQRVGLRTTLEVLTAQQNLANAELALISAHHDTYVAQTALLAQVGALQAEQLVAALPRYDAKRAFDRVKPWDWLTPWTIAPEILDKPEQLVERYPVPDAGRALNAGVVPTSKPKRR